MLWFARDSCEVRVANHLVDDDATAVAEMWGSSSWLTGVSVSTLTNVWTKSQQFHSDIHWLSPLGSTRPKVWSCVIWHRAGAGSGCHCLHSTTIDAMKMGFCWNGGCVWTFTREIWTCLTCGTWKMQLGSSLYIVSKTSFVVLH